MNDISTNSSVGRARVPLLVSGLCVTALVMALAVPPGIANAAITSNQTGTSDGYFYSLWTDGTGRAAMSLGAGGITAPTWTNAGNFIAGKGWRTGGRRAVRYSGTFNSSVWRTSRCTGGQKNPLVEYYIVESYGTCDPIVRGWALVVSDGASYEIYKMSDIRMSDFRARDHSSILERSAIETYERNHHRRKPLRRLGEVRIATGIFNT